MTRYTSSRLVAAAIVSLAWFSLSGQPAMAVEEAEKFLEGLRERGYHDMAVEYLEQVKDSPLVSDEFKKTILYEQGVTLVAAARSTGDARLRESLYEQAREKLEAFTKSNTGTALSAKANSQLANVLVERGREVLRRAENPTQAANKEKLRGEARKYFEDAEKLYATTDNFYAEELRKFPKIIPENDPQFEQRQQYRAEFVQAKLLVATVIYEKAKTYEKKSAESTKLLKDAAGKYGDMYDKYRNYLAGLYARYYQGRCHQDMDDFKTALNFYEDLVTQSDAAPAFRILISKSYAQIVECLIAEKKFDDAVTRGNEWLSRARGAEDRSPDWLAVKWQVALALEKKAEATSAEADKRRALRDARVLARDVSRLPNDFQTEAKAMVARLGAGSGEEVTPKTFDDAFTAAQEAIDMMQSTQLALKLAQENNKEAVPEMEQQLEESRDRAMEMFTLALGLRDADTNIDRVNLVRYYLCYLHWEANNYYEAALFGQFLAEKYPKSAGARQGAKIAMASYLSVYNDPDNPNKDFDAQQVINVAQMITRVWAGQPEADEAYDMLINFMIQQEKFAEAEAYLAQISPEFAQRGRAELKVGQALWAQYLRAVRKPEDERPAAEELGQLKQKAQSTLETGVERMRSADAISTTVTSAGLSLSQIYLDTSQYDKAVAILEDPKLGPLTLVAANHPATKQPDNYVEEAYKTALRAYVTVNPPQLEKAEKVMDELEAAVAQQGDGAAEKLTLIFIGLGRQLEEQIGVLKAEGKTDEIKQVAKSFEVFLDRVSGRQQGNTWASRNWVASTYYNLASGFENRGQLTDQGKSYYEKSIAGYQKILDEAESDSSFAPSPDAILGVQLRIAECHRKLGQFREALDLMGDILEKKPMMLDAQVTAAYLYQERGDAEDLKWYFYARQGGRKDPKTGKERIWGWGRLAQITARHPQYREIFHEARYNLTYCRLAEARKVESASKKKELLTRGKDDIRILLRLFSDLGGPEWRGKYDRLLKEIQKELGEKQDGLAVFNEKTETAATP